MLRYIIITSSLTMGAWIGSSQYPQIISHHLRLSPAIIGYLVICYPPRLADIWLRWYGQAMKTALFPPDNEVCSGRGHKFGPIFGTRSWIMCWIRSNIKSNTHDWFVLMWYSMCFLSKYANNQYLNIWLLKKKSLTKVWWELKKRCAKCYCNNLVVINRNWRKLILLWK